MGPESQEMGYLLYMVFSQESWVRLYEVPGYVYEIYLSAFDECQLEETVYDLAEFCDINDCSPKKILNNEIAAIFKITGILNAFAAVVYERTYVKSELELSKDVHFDLWQEVGKNLGRLIRYSTNFNVTEIWSHENL